MNNLQNPTYQKLRDLILASEGRTLEDELEKGCLVSLLNPSRSPWGDDSIFLIIQEPRYKYSNEGLLATIYNEDYDETGVYPVVKHDLEILGRSISLARVLRALGMHGIENGDVDLTHSYDGWIRIEFHAFTIKWIEGPLHLQTPETWEKLVEVLESNQ